MESERTGQNSDASIEEPGGSTTRREDAYLEVAFGMEAGKKFRLADTRIIIGRGDDAEFQLDDLTVSRHHASVEPDGPSYLLKDLGSPNGTRVAGEKVAEAHLSEGAAIEIGSVIIMLKHGSPPVTSESSGSMRERDTQELPVIMAGPDALGHVPSGPSPSMAPSEVSVRRRRLPVPAPIIAQIVSWAVVLIVAGGGVYVMNSLLDSSMAEFRATVKTEDGETKRVAGPPVPVPVRRQRPLLPQGTPAAELPLYEAPDVAQTLFDEASAALQAGDVDAAFAGMTNIVQRYPEFSPRAGGSLHERLAELEKLLSYEKYLEEAREVLGRDNALERDLQRVASQLSVIPTTHELFGEQALSLVVGIKERLREIQSAEPGGAVDPDAVEEPPTENGDGLKETDEGEATGEEAGTGEKSTESDKARGAARLAYQSSDFARAAQILREAAKNCPEDDKERLTAMAGRMEPFGDSYRQGRKLLDKPGREREAIKALEDALSRDSALFGSYRKRLNTSLATVHARLAARELEAGRYAKARAQLNLARKRDASSGEVVKLENIISFRATSLLRQAISDGDRSSALKAVEQVLAMAAPGSGEATEAAALKDKLAKTNESDG